MKRKTLVAQSTINPATSARGPVTRTALTRLDVTRTAWTTAALACAALISTTVLAADPPAVPVVVTTARSEKVGSTLQATGTVVSRNDARISGEVGGTLAWIAEPGANVKRGETVARIDGQRLSLALRDNEAALKRLEAQLRELLATIHRMRTGAG